MGYELFDVSKIKNLKFIYLYNKYNIAKYYPELLILFDDERLVCDYTHPLFGLLLKRVYELSLENKDITIFGKFDLDEVKKALDVGFNNDLDFENLESFRVLIWQEYVWKVVFDVIKLLRPNSNISFKGMSGFKNKYVLKYEIDGVLDMVSLLCFLKDDGLDFSFSYLEDEVIPVFGTIRRSFDSLILKYNFNDLFNKTYVYGNLDIDDFNKDIISKEAKAEEKEMINGYLKEFGLRECLNVYKTLDNSYLFFDYIDRENDEGIFISGEVFALENIYINYKEEYGISSFKQYLFMPVDGFKFFILFDGKWRVSNLPLKGSNYKNFDSSLILKK